MTFSKQTGNFFLTQNSSNNIILDVTSSSISVVSAIPRRFVESARENYTGRSDLLLNSMFQLSPEISINLIKMKNRDYYRLLINKEPIELKANFLMGKRPANRSNISMKTILAALKVCLMITNSGNFISSCYMEW